MAFNLSKKANNQPIEQDKKEYILSDDQRIKLGYLKDYYGTNILKEIKTVREVKNLTLPQAVDCLYNNLWGKDKEKANQEEMIGKNFKTQKTANVEQEPLTDVWQLESKNEEAASQMLGSIVTQAISGDEASQDYLTALWDGESWESILKKASAEGSTWYVWWMDGVHALMRDQEKANLEANETGLTQPELPGIQSCNCEFSIVEAKNKN